MQVQHQKAMTKMNTAHGHQSPSVSFGRFLFKYRSYVPVGIYVTMLLMPRNPFQFPALLWLTGAAIAGAGILLRLWAIRHIGKRARTTKDKARFLIATGPFALTRNPLYIANIFTGTGFCLLYGLPWYVPVYLFLIGAFYHFIVLYEEDLLVSLFGRQYVRYSATVSRWIPILRAPPPSQNMFPWMQVMRWERSFIGIILFGALATLARWTFL